jgi:hypothetical protein
MHETYADVQIAFVDAKVASAMCKGGAITYAIDDLTGISDDWILEHVVPCMVAHGIIHQVSKVLGRAVLFRIFDSSGEHAITYPIRECVTRAYNDLGARNALEEGGDPVKRFPLAVETVGNTLLPRT